MDALSLSDFDDGTVDKVFRLLELLEEMERHPKLKDQFALHGGTAINLFMLDVPRLSVDIDISYVGCADREVMMEKRPSLEKAVRQVGEALGYNISVNEPGHAGTTFILNYRGPRHSDHVKIDAIYMNRQPLLHPVMRSTALREGLKVRSFSDEELIGGKVKAFFDRVKIRDLYDISNLYRYLDSKIAANPNGEQELHEVILFYASVSARFPYDFKGREGRFDNFKTEVKEQLHPMIRKTSDHPTLSSMQTDAASFIDRWVKPRSEKEQEFLREFEAGNYEPTLLFSDPKIADRARRSPQALWKLENLRKRK